jgi:hypothetical protein
VSDLEGLLERLENARARLAELEDAQRDLQRSAFMVGYCEGALAMDRGDVRSGMQFQDFAAVVGEAASEYMARRVKEPDGG